MLLLILSSCKTDEIGRTSIKDTREYQILFHHTGGKIEVWTDLDVEFKGDSEFWYEIVITENGNEVAETRCDPFLVSDQLMARTVQAEGKTKVSYIAKMTCSFNLPQGEYDAKVSFEAVGREITIFWADVILKYPREQ